MHFSAFHSFCDTVPIVALSNCRLKDTSQLYQDVVIATTKVEMALKNASVEVLLQASVAREKPADILCRYYSYKCKWCSGWLGMPHHSQLQSCLLVLQTAEVYMSIPHHRGHHGPPLSTTDCSVDKSLSFLMSSLHKSRYSSAPLPS